jgi:hypothetical protein
VQVWASDWEFDWVLWKAHVMELQRELERVPPRELWKEK